MVFSFVSTSALLKIVLFVSSPSSFNYDFFFRTSFLKTTTVHDKIEDASAVCIGGRIVYRVRKVHRFLNFEVLGNLMKTSHVVV